MGHPPKQPPLMTCLACRGTWFRQADYYQFLPEESIGGYWTTGPDLVGKNSIIPMTIAVCLCGTPQTPNIGGVR
jgi:hypothetical protein